MVTEAAKGITALRMTRWNDKEDEADREDSEKCVRLLLDPVGIIAWRLFGFSQTVKLADKRGENEDETMVTLLSWLKERRRWWWGKELTVHILSTEIR